ncbi:outer membrane protein [Methylosinus sp. Sm6]|uniref:outer membrane protein n=1 Tax=Methylosinus sp. Sm6 TaxID=2866948 RepID=UPI001C999657|nr:outer membrane beta-barrel protein [Methylosinus sp. Sm6]MBY6241038.1 outer membrane beta-barrel protein [Methylosinus sp. Sm6]
MKFPAFRALLCCAALGVAAGPARAADMPFFSPPDAPIDAQAELGTGWYLRGDVGYANITSPQVIADIINATARTGSISGSIGAGYQYNSWLRTEIALDRSVIRPNATGNPIWCPYTARPLNSPTIYDSDTGEVKIPSHPAGYSYDPNETCQARTTGNMSRITGLFNAYIDLGSWFGFTPYVGAGLGASYVRTSGAVSYYKTSDGSPYAADLSPTDGYPLAWINLQNGNYENPNLAWAPQNWNRNVSKSSWKFAWALFAGASYDLSENFKIDIGYRFLNSGKYTGLAGFSGATPKSYDLISHEVRLGVRVTTD